ncbi:MAG: O-antigen ligase family protein, partial [Firmicutes bacterium]|nr:O-antigen ligase family protein [Bacillota bacterium]
GTGLALTVLAEVIAGGSGRFFPGMGWPWERGAGTLGNPNVAGAYLAAVFPILHALPGPPWVRWPLGGIILAALIGTGSRGGWTAAFMGTVWFMRRQRSPYLPWVVTVVFLALLLPSPVGRRFWAGFLLCDSTAKARLTVWREAMGLFLRRPSAGWGMAAPLGWAAHPHSLFLEILLTGGLWAAAGFLPLGIRLARLLFGRSAIRVETASGASLVSLLVFGLGDAVLTTPVLAALFWLTVGLVLPRRAEEEP